MKALIIGIAVISSLISGSHLGGPDAGVTLGGTFVQFEYLPCYLAGAEMFEDGSC